MPQLAVANAVRRSRARTWVALTITNLLRVTTILPYIGVPGVAKPCQAVLWESIKRSTAPGVEAAKTWQMGTRATLNVLPAPTLLA